MRRKHARTSPECMRFIGVIVWINKTFITVQAGRLELTLLVAIKKYIIPR